MPSDISFLEFVSDPDQDIGSSDVFSEYLLNIANKKMRRYKQIIHTRGEKQGQSYYSHVMDLVTIAEKLRPASRKYSDRVGAAASRCFLSRMARISPGYCLTRSFSSGVSHRNHLNF